MKLGRLNSDGEEAFKNLLTAHEERASNAHPREILESEEFVESRFQTDLPDVRLSSRKELAQTVLEALLAENIDYKDVDKGIWLWITAFYFDSLCEKTTDGFFSPKALYRYMPSDDYKHFYRHLVIGPVRILKIFESNYEDAMIVLCQPPSQPGDFVEQLSSRMERITSRGVIGAATKLFYDNDTKRPKKGTSPKEHRPGTLRRFLAVLDQLDLTFDLQAISKEDLLEIISSEFSAR